LFATLVAARAHAEEAPIVERAAVLLFSGCGVEGAPPRAVSDVLSLELRAANIRLKGEAEGFGEGDLLLVVRGGCEASAPLTLRASVSGSQRERSLVLDDVPASARARTLALSLAELGELVVSGAPPDTPISAEDAAAKESAPEAAAPAAKPETPTKPATPPATKAKPAPATRRARPPAPIALLDERTSALLTEPAREPSHDFLALTLIGRWFGFEQLAWGGRARLELGPILFGAEALYGTARSDLGDVQGLVTDVLVGVHVFSLPRSGLVSFAVGPRVGFGAVNVTGQPTNDAVSSSRWDVYFDAALAGDLRIETADAGLSMSFELGAARGVVALADGNRVSEFGGFFIGLSLGIGFGL
jgi:hypothetical protein